MARYISLKLVNEQGNPHPWPGIPSAFQIGSEQAADAVWIGVSEDGSTNQVYPLNTPLATITANWPRVYQGVKLNLLSATDDSPAQVTGGEYVYSNSLIDFQRRVAACCIADQIEGSPSPGQCIVTIDWVHFGGNGTLVIEVDGDEVVNSGAGGGQIMAPAGSTVRAIVTGGVSVNALSINSAQAGTIYSSVNGSGEDGEDFTFNPECGQDYTIGAQTTA